MNTATDFTPDRLAVQQTLNGNLEAFDSLVLKYQRLALNRAVAILGDPMLAEDVTQESFIKAFQKIHTLRGDSFRAWLLKIVTNTSISQLRYQKSLRTQPLYGEYEDSDDVEGPFWLFDTSVSIEAAADYNEDSKTLYQVLDELPEIYRCVLVLVDLYELDLAVAAKELDIPLGTVKSRIARARLRVKNKLLEQVYKDNFCLGGLGNSMNANMREQNAVCTNRNAKNHPKYRNQNGTIRGERASTRLRPNIDQALKAFEAEGRFQ